MENRHETEPVSLAEICEENKTHFSSMKTLIQGAFSLVEYFEHIHRNGYVYGSNDTGPFRFCLQTGKLVQDADQYLVRAYSSLSDANIIIDEFLAPELVEAAAAGEDYTFTMETDWYFLSVFLFEYFFHTGSPFEGKMMVNRCFLSPLEKEMYRVEQGQFCMDLGEVKNTPVKGIQDKLIRYWEEYPRILGKMFQRAFIEAGSLSSLRPTEVDWKQLFVRMAMDYQTCRCGFSGFSFRLKEKENGTFACPKCGRAYYPLTNGMDRIFLTEGGKLYACQTGRDLFDKDTVTGLVVENKRKKGLFGIKNVSNGIWRGMYPDHTIKEIGRDQGIPIWNGMKIRFELGEDWGLNLSPVHAVHDIQNAGDAYDILDDSAQANESEVLEIEQ